MRALLVIMVACALCGCGGAVRDSANLEGARKLVLADLRYSARTDTHHADSVDVLVKERFLDVRIGFKCDDGVVRDYIWLGPYENAHPGNLILFYAPEPDEHGLLVARIGGGVEVLELNSARRQIAQCEEFFSRLKRAKPGEQVMVPYLYDRVYLPK